MLTGDAGGAHRPVLPRGLPGIQQVSSVRRDPGGDAVRAAQRLLDAGPDRPEDRIRNDIGRLLDSPGVAYLLSFRRRGDGPRVRDCCAGDGCRGLLWRPGGRCKPEFRRHACPCGFGVDDAAGRTGLLLCVFRVTVALQCSAWDVGKRVIRSLRHANGGDDGEA